MTSHRNIGGSFLPSSSPRILVPIECSFGRLQVRADHERDTHDLVLVAGGRETVLASHANGFSCHALATRMEARSESRVRDQLEYIVECGGQTMPADQVVALMAAPAPHPMLSQQIELGLG